MANTIGSSLNNVVPRAAGQELVDELQRKGLPIVVARDYTVSLPGELQ